MRLYLFIAILFLGLGACHPAGEDGSELAIISGIENGGRIGNFKLLPANSGIPQSAGTENGPTWPGLPRREWISQVSDVTRTTMKFEVYANSEIPQIGKVEAAGFLEIPITWTTTISTILMARNRAEKGETLWDVSNPKAIRVNYWEGRDMIVICHFHSSYSVASNWGSRLKGNAEVPAVPLFVTLGASTEVKRERVNTYVAALNEFAQPRYPRVGESQEQLIASCTKGYEYEDVDGNVHKMPGKWELSRKTFEIDMNAGLASAYLHIPGAQCTTDEQCVDYYARQPKSQFDLLTKEWTTPRCVASKNGNLFCDLRGKKGATCPVYGKLRDDGKVEQWSRGWFEFTCDEKEKLKCKTVEEPRFLSIPYGYSRAKGSAYWYDVQIGYAKGECG